MAQTNGHIVSGCEFAMSSGSIPYSGVRSSAQTHQTLFHSSGSPDYDWTNPTPTERPSKARRLSRNPALHQNAEFAVSDFDTAYSDPPNFDLSQSNGTGAALIQTTMSGDFSAFGEDQEFAKALSSFQPCDDCTPATKTTIPHHHHSSSRLTGTSATLAGHFCCCWLVHGQPCFLCFESAEALDSHIKSDHAGKDGTYRCLWQDCSKIDNSTKTAGTVNFGNKPKLMRHVHSHTGYKPFMCTHSGCDKGFVTKEQLKNHETTHTKAREYKCEQCGKAFAVKSALTTHIAAVHDDNKSHVCEMCGKAFADSSNLSKHKQTHFREGLPRKQRNKRAASSTGSTPSTPTLSAEPLTPVVKHISETYELSGAQVSPGLMAPPALPKPCSANLNVCTANTPPSTCCAGTLALSTTSSPPPEDPFDPNCYCCEQRCPPPQGPPTPCNEAEELCDKDGFCDLPGCLEQFAGPETYSTYACDGVDCGEAQGNHYESGIRWDDAFEHPELEEQFNGMHAHLTKGTHGIT